MKIRNYLKAPISTPRWTNLLLEIVSVVLIVLFLKQMYSNSMMQTTIQELSMQKEALIRQINENDQNRSALQKSLWEAIDKGLNSNDNTQKLHAQDEKIIESSKSDIDADSVERIFKRKFGNIRQLPNKKRR